MATIIRVEAGEIRQPRPRSYRDYRAEMRCFALAWRDCQARSYDSQHREWAAEYLSLAVTFRCLAESARRYPPHVPNSYLL